jgi:hypothetical protein
MSVTYVWSINYMDTKPSEDGLTDVVISCQWSVQGSEQQTPSGPLNYVNPSYTASNFGYTKFAPPQAGDFTAYANLTQEQVLGWVWAAPAENGGVDKAAVEQGLADNIAQQQNPPTVILPNPWAQPTEA